MTMAPHEIRALRAALGLSAAEFAERLGFTGPNRARTVYRYERDQRKPSPQVVMIMKQLAALHNVPVSKQ